MSEFIPYHVAIIMDGNRRWARKNLLSHRIGYKEGFDCFCSIIPEIFNKGISHVTLFAFSKENMKRCVEDKEYIYDLVNNFLLNIIEGRAVVNYNTSFLGDFVGLPDFLQRSIKKVMQLNAEKSSMKHFLHVAFNYGGQQEILKAVNRAFFMKSKNSVPFTLSSIKSLFYVPSLPDVDLLIRTGGEKRLSNFLLWHCAYAEIYFTEVLWPDFTIDNFNQALSFFFNRERRFGGS